MLKNFVFTVCSSVTISLLDSPAHLDNSGSYFDSTWHWSKIDYNITTKYALHIEKIPKQREIIPNVSVLIK